MASLELRYVAHISAITGKLAEHYETDAATLRQLVKELDMHYPGFRETIEDPNTGRLSLKAMIYYGDKNRPHLSVTDLDSPIRRDGHVLVAQQRTAPGASTRTLRVFSRSFVSTFWANHSQTT